MLRTPPLQTATATIDTLCGRLQSATLLEDRRNAIMGLRSFAKQYPASVAGGSLRELIAILRRDGLGEIDDQKSQNGRERSDGDVDTIRLVLETLLMLFNPDSSSPEASDEIALFMADEFSMRQDNVSLLLSFLDPTSPVADYYSRLYSIQLLSAICAARPERLQECVLGAPLGVSRVVSMLDDGRDAVRNAGLVFLVDLTTGASDDLRKIVAFEDVFSKAFTVIQLEGGLGEAGITAQDCLSLVANLLRDSPSNQTMFRESGCVKEMHTLLQQAFPSTDDHEAAFVLQNREKATWGLLQLLSVILAAGQTGTAQNQTSFFRAGMAQTLIDIGFAESLPLPIRIAALKNSGLLIDSNPPLQEAFASLSVLVSDSMDTSVVEVPLTNGQASTASLPKDANKSITDQARAYVIEALLTRSLDDSQQEFIMRATCTGLIEAYLAAHSRIKAHFLQRAIAGHVERETAANVLSSLLNPSSDLSAITFAAQIAAGLIDGENEAKVALASVKEGNESEGEDVLTAIQIMGAHLGDALQNGSDIRTIAAYAGLLIVLLWEFPEGIDQLLADGSGLIQALAGSTDINMHPPIQAGLSAVLLGVIYEFSSKDSPIPRRTLTPILTQKIGRTKYLGALSSLRKVSAIRDFDLDDVADTDKLLSRPFIDLFTTEYTRLRKAIDKDPGIEVVQMGDSQTGVDRDVLDTLREEIESLKDALATAQADAETSSQKNERERLASSQELQKALVEVDRIRKINESIQQGHERDHDKLTKNHEQQIQKLRMEQSRTLADARQEEKRQSQIALQETERKHVEKIKEGERKLVELGNTHRAEQVAHRTSLQQLESVTARHNDIAAREAQLAKELTELTARHAKSQRDLQDAVMQTNRLTQETATLRPKLDQLETELERVSQAKQEAEEEVRTRDKELAAERAGFADLEKEIANARSKISTLEQDQKLSKDTKHKLAELEQELAGSKSQAADLEKQISTAEEAARSTEKETDSLKSKIQETEAELNNAREKIKSLEKDSPSAKTNADKTSSEKLRKDLKTKTDELAAEKAKVGKLQKELQVAKTALSTAQSKSPSSPASSKESAAKVTKLEKELKEIRESEKSAKEELESMLLVMGDIESKRDEYRDKVKALGGEVSEDEEEEDEDEDEDSDEDGEANKRNDDDDVD